MENKRHELGSNELEVYSHQDKVDRKLLRGRIFVDTDIKRTTFFENTPQGPRSTQVGRTQHARLVRKPQSDEYKITFRFSWGEKYLKETLISEVRTLIKEIETERNTKKEVSVERSKK